MFGLLLFFVALFASITSITVLYRRKPYKTLTPEKPRIVFFPKYLANYQRDDAEVEHTITQLGFSRDPLTGLYRRGLVRSGLTTKSVKLTISVDREKKEVAVYSTFFGILLDNGDLWQVTHDIVNGLETQSD